MGYTFRWNEWNREKIALHGVSPEEAEYVVNHAGGHRIKKVGDEKYLVRGQTSAGAYLQVVFLQREDDEAFVIYSRPLTAGEKRTLRRRTGQR